MLKNNDKSRKTQFIRLGWITGILLMVIVASALISSDVPTDVFAESAITDSAATATTPENTVKGEPLTETDATAFISDGNGYFSALSPILRMVAALFVVILCIYVGLYVLRRMMGKKQRLSRNGNAIELIQTEFIAPKRAVSLVKVANRSVLIGVTDNQLSLITELSEEETAQIIQENAVVSQPDQFGQILGKAMSKLREWQPKPGVTPVADGVAGNRQ